MKTISVSAGALLFLGCARLAAQAGSSPQWGESSTSAYVVSALDMTPTSSSVQWESTGNQRYITGMGSFQGAVHVPQGALLLSIELEACDASDQAGVSVGFFRTEGAGLVALLANAHTGSLETPGCSRFPADVNPTFQVVDNGAHVYFVNVHNETADGLTSVIAVRVFYKLQVSPPPGEPTFGDVPASDPAFQFIEALVASGVTAGCGGGNFCPDAPLTRRQMAVFLSKALGLSWAEVPAP